LLSHISMTQLSAIEKPTISANDFYWRTAANICGRRDVIGWGGEDPQSLLMGFFHCSEKLSPADISETVRPRAKIASDSDSLRGSVWDSLKPSEVLEVWFPRGDA
jgi:hypothetical protein